MFVVLPENVHQNYDISEENKKKIPGKGPRIPIEVQDQFFDPIKDLAISNKHILDFPRMRTIPKVLEMFKSARKIHKCKEKTAISCFECWAERKGLIRKKMLKHKVGNEPEDKEGYQVETDTISLNIGAIDFFKKDFSQRKNLTELKMELRLVIWEFTKLPCSFRLEMSKINSDELVVVGQCSEKDCKCEIKIETKKQKTQLDISYIGYSENTRHNNIIEMLKENNPCPCSTPTEAALRTLKKRVFQTSNSIRPDHYLEKHLAFLRGYITGGDHDEIENAIVESPCSTSSTESNYQLIPVLKNGFLNEKVQPMLETSETCGFDSFFHAYLASYVDIPSFKAMIDESKGDFAALIKLAIGSRKKENVYIARNDLLEKFYNNDMDARYRKNTITKDIISINCNTSANVIFNMICNRQHELASFIEKIFCEYCNSIKSSDKFIHHYHVNYNSFDIKNIQSSIAYNFEKIIKQTCDGCGKRLKRVRTTQKSLVIDSENVLDASKVKVEEISQSIIVQNKFYKLKAAIELLPNHFVVHIRRGNNWEIYDDFKNKNILRSKRRFRPVQLIFIEDGNFAPNATSTSVTHPITKSTWCSLH